ncbi:hypothetical protein KP509_11G091000 [Ceratopteris richardii]|uniref:Uncharacterized protein n=1 Tax=Ceratopteris richardii TaxID=49495 RepID=A0A8T2TXS2_CERRI|nr:hypothetical protein KP509_11G091000 [Ceratopteris richardii]
MSHLTQVSSVILLEILHLSLLTGSKTMQCSKIDRCKYTSSNTSILSEPK